MMSMKPRAFVFAVVAAAVLTLAPGLALGDEADLAAGSVGMTAQADASGGAMAMHRLYNPNSGEHFYTAEEGERDAVAAAGWNYEGMGWAAPTGASAPVYRLYNKYGGEHHYTTDKSERDHLVKVGWNDEGIGWYSDDSKAVPLYRLYNPNAFANNHHYTTSADERDHLVSLGWKNEGIAWYGEQLGESAKADIALKSLNGWWQSVGEVGLRWCHVVDGVMYVYKGDWSSVYGNGDGSANWSAGVFSHFRTATFTVSAFGAGSTRLGKSGGYRAITSAGGSYLYFDDDPNGLICSELDGKHYSAGGGYLRNFNPPAGLLSIARQTESG